MTITVASRLRNCKFTPSFCRLTIVNGNILIQLLAFPFTRQLNSSVFSLGSGLSTAAVEHTRNHQSITMRSWV